MRSFAAAAAAAALLAFTSPSSATVSFVAGAAGYQGPAGADFEAATSATLNGWTEAGMTFATGGSLVQNFTDGNGAYPFGRTPAGQNYVTVLGGASLTADLAAAVNRIGFYWGSVDTYNTIQLVDSVSSTVVGTLTGFDVTPTLGNNGNQGSYATNRYVDVLSTVAFDRVIFTSSSNSFEIDNLAAGVPEPSTWAMMLLGFLGLGVATARRSRKAVAAAALA